MSNHIELLKKLKALADIGVDGEKQSAQIMLQKMLTKYGISIEEIEGDKIERKQFKIKLKDQTLFIQILAHVCGHGKQLYGKGVDLFVDMTDSQYIETQCKFEFFKEQYDKEVSLFYEAFVMRNELYPETLETRQVSELTDEQKERWYRAKEMAQSIKQSHYNKQLSC